jgi:hypothetical protein
MYKLKMTRRVVPHLGREGLRKFTVEAGHIVDRQRQSLLQKTLQEYVGHLEGNGEGGWAAGEDV